MTLPFAHLSCPWAPLPKTSPRVLLYPSSQFGVSSDQLGPFRPHQMICKKLPNPGGFSPPWQWLPQPHSGMRPLSRVLSLPFPPLLHRRADELALPTGLRPVRRGGPPCVPEGDKEVGVTYLALQEILHFPEILLMVILKDDLAPS